MRPSIVLSYEALRRRRHRRPIITKVLDAVAEPEVVLSAADLNADPRIRS